MTGSGLPYQVGYEKVNSLSVGVCTHTNIYTRTQPRKSVFPQSTWLDELSRFVGVTCLNAFLTYVFALALGPLRRKVKKIFWKTPYFELIFLIMHRKFRKNSLKRGQKSMSKLSTAPRRGGIIGRRRIRGGWRILWRGGSRVGGRVRGRRGGRRWRGLRRHGGSPCRWLFGATGGRRRVGRG